MIVRKGGPEKFDGIIIFVNNFYFILDNYLYVHTHTSVYIFIIFELLNFSCSMLFSVIQY